MDHRGGTKRRRIVAVCGLVGLLAWLFWAPLSSSPEKLQDRQAGPTAAVPTMAAEEADAAAVSPGPGRDGFAVRDASVPQADDDAAEHPALRHYRDLTRYPSSTRRIDENSFDLLNPGARHEKRRPLPAAGDDDDGAWEVRLTADRYFLNGPEAAEITLELWHHGEPVEPRGVTMIAQAPAADVAAPDTLLAVDVGEGRASALLAPEDYWPELVGDVRVTTIFSADELAEQTGFLSFYFTADSRVPARFTGDFSDALRGGDLVVDVGVDVVTAGDFQVDALLYDAGGRPFGWAQFSGALAEGTRAVPLRYFGLLFHDAQALPPYTLQGLRGRRLRPRDVPNREEMPAAAGAYITRGQYELAGFNNEENPSPHRQKMLDRYRDAIDRGVQLTEPELLAGTR